MSRSVAELLAVSGSVDHRPAGGVDVVATVGTGAHRADAGELRLEDDVVEGAALPPARRRRRCG